jgi:predicted ATP-grasp superfamily ATP-dependent carboligase
MRQPEQLLIIGASARAAAFSALRAGLQPWCVDLFADADLQARCPVRAVAASRFPAGLIVAAAQAPPGPWIYTGALENHPGLVRSLSQVRPLWGNTAETLRKARSPVYLARIFQRADIPAPCVSQSAPSKPRRSPFLLKPLKGSAGRQIRFTSPARPAGPGFYLQEFIEGETCSATYVADGKTAQLLGSTRQLVGTQWLRAGPFSYCGSIGPQRLAPALEQTLARIGRVLAEECGLRGLFGVDFILREKVAWPVEVNPRYTASVEVLEYATTSRALELQRLVGEGSPLPEPLPVGPAAALVGKAILFARQSLSFPADGPWARVLTHPVSLDDLPAFADLPHAGQQINAGSPILTLFTRGPSVQSCQESLREIARDLDRCLFRP